MGVGTCAVGEDGVVVNKGVCSSDVSLSNESTISRTATGFSISKAFFFPSDSSFFLWHFFL